MDVRQASERYGLRAGTIRNWIRDGELPAIKIGRSYEITDRDIRRAREMPRRRGRPSAIQLTSRARWFRLIHFPQGSQLALGDASETWRDDLRGNWDAYRELLPDVAEAAAAVEYTAENVHRAIAVTEAHFAPYLPGMLEGPEPEFGRHASHPAVSDAYSEFATMLWWIRALDDRLEHQYRRRALGLLPALARGRLRDRVRRLVANFRRTLGAEAGHLANYSLHHSTIPYAFNSSARILDGRLELPIPDRVTAPVTNRRALTYAEGRTLSAYADTASDLVVTFMDALLQAFHEELPSRVRRDTAPPHAP